MQLQADLLGCPMERAMIEEIGALGVELSCRHLQLAACPCHPAADRRHHADTMRSIWRAAIVRACS